MVNRIMRLTRQVRARPTDARVWIELARAQVEAGSHADAIESLTQATRNATNQPDVWRGVGETCVALGWYDRAREALACAARLDPASVEVHLALGDCLLAQAEASAASTAFAAALWLCAGVGPLVGRTRAGLARALLAQGELDAAEAQLTLALETEAPTVEPWLVRADLSATRGDALGCIEALQRAFALEPHTLEVGLRLAEALHAEDRDHEAYSVLRGVHAHHGDNGDVLGAMGRIEWALGRNEAAVGNLRRAARQGGHRAAWSLSALLAESGRPAEALDALRQAHRAAPDDAEVAATLAGQLLALELTDEAFKVLARATLSNRNDARLHALLGQACDRHGGFQPGGLDLGLDLDDGEGPPLDREDPAVFSGDLSQFNLLELLEFLRVHRRTGSLRVAAPTGVAGEVLLVDGALASATTTDIDRLGDRLRAARLVSPAELEGLAALQRSLPEPPALGVLLLARELVTPEALRAVVLAQAEAAIAVILAWPAGRFAFETDEGVRAALAHPTLALDTGHLLMEVLRKSDERRAGLRHSGEAPTFTGELGEFSLSEYNGPDPEA